MSSSLYLAATIYSHTRPPPPLTTTEMDGGERAQLTSPAMPRLTFDFIRLLLVLWFRQSTTSNHCWHSTWTGRDFLFSDTHFVRRVFVSPLASSFRWGGKDNEKQMLRDVRLNTINYDRSRRRQKFRSHDITARDSQQQQQGRVESLNQRKGAGKPVISKY